MGAHFPLPYAEIAADIVSGRIDAVEMQVFAPGLDSPPILEWYRFLNCGYRLPVLGGTDKMSAEVPVGAIRTYARLAPDEPPSFDAWAAAVRAGRTFATSGPVLELAVDGHEPGDTVALSPGGGRLEIRARARAAQPVIGSLEVVMNGRVVAHERRCDAKLGGAPGRDRRGDGGRLDRGPLTQRARGPFGLRDHDGRPYVAGLRRGPGSSAVRTRRRGGHSAR